MQWYLIPHILRWFKLKAIHDWNDLFFFSFIFLANKIEWEKFFIFILENLQHFTMNDAPEKAAESLSNFEKTLRF